MNFPTRENHILALANQMYHGFLFHAGDFPTVNRMGLNLKRLFYKIAKATQAEDADIKDKKLKVKKGLFMHLFWYNIF